MTSRTRMALRLVGLSCIAPVISSCQDSQFPTPPDGSQPSFALSDGANGTVGNRNTDVFFLPPLVASPSGQPGFADRPANPDLAAVARICRLNATETGPNPALPTCVEGGTLSPDLPMVFNPTGQFYQANLKDGGFSLSNAFHYRIQIFVGTSLLAFRDIDPDRNPPTASCGGEAFCQFNNHGSGGLPIKVRIETAALCFVPSSDPSTPGTFNLPCASGSIDVAAGGSVVLEDEGEVVATTVVQSGAGGSAASLMAETVSQGGGVSTITLTACPAGYLNPVFIDLPTFSDCVDIETDPPLSTFGAVGIASLCQAVDAAGAASEAQQDRITILNLTDEANGIVVALPDADGFCPPPSSPAPTGLSLGPFDRLMKFARAGWQSVREHVRTWFGPEPLWASLVCDRGCGGIDFDSPVQAALPAQMDYPADSPHGGNLGTHPVGTTVTAKVVLTDASGTEPVAGATVRFTVTGGGGSVSAASATTGPDGIATVTWTLGPDLNTLVASGRGIADPSCVDDPNFPCGPDGVFAANHSTGPQEKVTLGVGMLTFTAIGQGH